MNEPAGGSGLDEMLAEADRSLAGADRALARDYPGPRPGRQPVHIVYVPADRFAPGLAARWGRQALKTLETCAPSPGEFGAAMGLPPGLAADVRSRVLAKLIAEPIEDLRLDFEDGYGDRGDDAEDADARAAAACLAGEAAAGPVVAGTEVPFCGLRCKSLEPPTRRRAIRTLAEFLAGVLARGPLPAGFTVTLPKVTSPDQVAAMARRSARPSSGPAGEPRPWRPSASLITTTLTPVRPISRPVCPRCPHRRE